MSDVFLSYAKEDREQARVLAEALKGQGWSVFWDRTIPPGLSWHDYIGQELQEVRCVLVAWSVASVKSDWVLEEAGDARKRGVLIPLFLDEVTPPLGFRSLQAADLSSWDGNPQAGAFEELVGAMERLLGSRPAPATGVEGREQEEPTEVPTEPSRSRTRIETVRRAVVAAVLIAAVALLFWYGLRGDQPAADPTISEAKSKAAADPTIPEAKDKADRVRGEGAPSWAEDEEFNRRVLIRAGEFWMGHREGVEAPDHERPQHQVQLSSFFIQEHEVTNAEYERFKPAHQFLEGHESHPVVNVSWEEARDYAAWLGGRLPTEAEWEYACRAGTETLYWSGDEEEDLARVGWYQENSNGLAHPVRQLDANPWGLYDMHGNVWEWVADWYGQYPEHRQINPLNEDPSTDRRVIRGGTFGVSKDSARSGTRAWVPAEWDWIDEQGVKKQLGFRVAWPVP